MTTGSSAANGASGPRILASDKLAPGHALAIAIDTLVDAVHFPTGTAVEDIAYKALAVNLSDLAAIGAVPLSAIYVLATEHVNQPWAQAFTAFITCYARSVGIPIDGEVSRAGSTSVSVQVFGEVPYNQHLSRAGARPGDVVMVTGTLGDAGIGLALEQGRMSASADDERYLTSRLRRPTPRLREALILRGLASAAIDVSDGLLADLGHILEKSHCGATVSTAALPLSESALRVTGGGGAVESALGAGDDYELCFTCGSDALESIQRQFLSIDSVVTRIGTVESAPGLRCTGPDGAIHKATRTGWQHFS